MRRFVLFTLIIPVLFGCESQILKSGQEVTIVGFGNIGADTPSPNGHKRWVQTTVKAVRSKEIDIGNAMQGNCFGDSGGPAFVKMPDGTWRVFGATSTDMARASIATRVSTFAMSITATTVVSVRSRRPKGRTSASSARWRRTA